MPEYSILLFAVGHCLRFYDDFPPENVCSFQTLCRHYCLSVSLIDATSNDAFPIPKFCVFSRFSKTWFVRIAFSTMYIVLRQEEFLYIPKEKKMILYCLKSSNIVLNRLRTLKLGFFFDPTSFVLPKMCVCMFSSFKYSCSAIPRRREQVLNSIWVTGKKRLLYTFLVVILRTDNRKYISCYLLLSSRYNTVMAVSLSMRVVWEIFITTLKKMDPCRRSGIRYISCKNNIFFIQVVGRTIIYIIGPNVFKHRRRSVYTVVRFP